MNAATETRTAQFDFSDALDVLHEVRRREHHLSLDIGDNDPLNPLFADDCLGDGFWHHPLLAAPGHYIRERSVSMSGEIRDGRGYHPAATFNHTP